MKIKELKIRTFAGIKDRTITFEDDFNHLTHKNEFGKSSIIEALKAGIYGFSPIKNYPYLPLSAEKIDFTCKLNLQDEARQLTNVELTRLHSGERVQSKISYQIDAENSKKSKAIRNKSLFDALKENDGIILNEIHPDCWIIDSDSIEEHKKFLKNIKKSSVSLYESINYKGNSLADIRQIIDKQKREIYTNSANSNSKIKKNQAQILKINQHIKELVELENKKQEDYTEYLALSDKSLLLEDELIKLKAAKSKLEKDKEFYTLKSDYQKLQVESELNAYHKLEDSPKLAEVSKLKDKLNSIEEKTSEIQSKLVDEDKKNFDTSLEKLVLLDKDSQIKELFAKSIELEQAKTELRTKKNILRESALIDACDIDIEKAKSELFDYCIEFSKLEQFDWINKKTFFKNKEGLYFVIILLILFSTYASIYAGISMAFVSFLVILFIKNKEKQEKFTLQNILDFSADKYFELQKLSRGQIVISSLKKPSDEMIELIKKDLAVIKAYQNEKIAYVKLSESLAYLLENESEIAEVFRQSKHNVLDLERLYSSEQAAIKFSLQLKSDLSNQLLNLEKQKIELKNNIDNVEQTLIDLWGTCDLLKLEKIFENAKLNQKQIKLLEIELNNFVIDDDINDRKNLDIANELIALEQKKVQTEDSLLNIKQSIARLEERLSSQDLVVMPEYQGLTVAEIQNVKENIKKQNQKLAIDYNILALKDRLIQRSFQILKTKLKPAYVKAADNYLSTLASDCNVNIEYSASSEIVFKDKKTAELLDFKMLSTGTQAQVVLSLKIAYLDNLDPTFKYPIIIDDALMAYDDARKKSSLKLLQELSKKRQIIYFEAV